MRWWRASLLASPTRVAGLDTALTRDGAGAREDRLKQRGFAALERADQRHAARDRSHVCRCFRWLP